MPASKIDWAGIGRRLLAILGVLGMLGAIALTIAPIFIRTDTYGQHDWDPMEAHRYLPVKTIKLFHQFPFWNPYNCGGHTWWGGMESGINLVSPWFPIYMLASLPWALRLEIVGTTLLSAVGTWLFAGRFTKSPGLRLLAVVAFSLNSRFGLQTAVGHTWHLYYAWMPWALFFLDRAIAVAPAPWTPEKKKPLREIVLMGAMLAMMVWTGGIYPLPQTVFAIAWYSIACAIAMRSWRPIGYAIAGGLLSAAFSAPRLFPLIDMLRRFPRLVDSNESLSISEVIAVFTAKEAEKPSIAPWGWHEFGIYVGWAPLLVMILGLFAPARARERALRLAGAMCLLLGLGRFHEYAPWGILHDHFPVFESQHVPSRWLYPMALLLVVAGVAIVERWLARQGRRSWLEAAILAGAAWVAVDVALETQRPLVGAFVRTLSAKESTGPFHMETTARSDQRYDVGDWAPAALGPMMANVGTTDCSTFPGLHSYYRDRSGHTPGLGAKGREEPGYRGEAYVLGGVGVAHVIDWTPNAVTVDVEGAKPGDVLVLNQNWDPGWRASGSDGVVDANGAVGAKLREPNGEIVFRYVPRFFWFGILVFVLTVAGLIWVPRVMARSERKSPSR